MKKLFLAFTFMSFSSLVSAKSALIIVDMQNCFVPGADASVHSLPVNGGNDLVDGINKIQQKFDYVVATLDWHPVNHVSFATTHHQKAFTSIKLNNGLTQALWPDHCVQGTKGAELVSGLDQTHIDKKIYKGTNPAVDSYSGFFDNAKLSQTELDQWLKSKQVTEVYVVGLAADFCVKFTSIDAASLNYKTYFVKDLTKAVFPEKLKKETYKELRKAGVKLIKSKNI